MKKDASLIKVVKNLRNNPKQENLKRILARSNSHLIRKKTMKRMMRILRSQRSCTSIQIPQKILIGNQFSWQSRLIRWEYPEAKIEISRTAGMIIQMYGSIAISKAVLLRRRVDSRMHTGNTAGSTIRTSTSNLSNRWKSCISVQALAVSSVKEKDWKKSVSVYHFIWEPLWFSYSPALSISSRFRKFSIHCHTNPFCSLYSLLQVLSYSFR